MNAPLSPQQLRILQEAERKAAAVARNKELARQHLLAIQLALARRPIK